MGSFYTLPFESLVVNTQLPKLNHSIHSQEDSDNNSEAYIAISYDSVEYRKLLKKVKNEHCVCMSVVVVKLGEVRRQPTQTYAVLQKQSHE